MVGGPSGQWRATQLGGIKRGFMADTAASLQYTAAVQTKTEDDVPEHHHSCVQGKAGYMRAALGYTCIKDH